MGIALRRPAELRRLSLPYRDAWVARLDPEGWPGLEAPVETLEKRITKRRDDASDATPEILRKQLDYDLGQMAWQRLDCSGDIEQTVSRANALCR